MEKEIKALNKLIADLEADLDALAKAPEFQKYKEDCDPQIRAIYNLMIQIRGYIKSFNEAEYGA